jgi:hypothetical protein
MLSRGEFGEAFIHHALSLTPTRHVIVLLAIDFDSTKNCTDLFRDNPMFAGKICLARKALRLAPLVDGGA